MRSLLFSALVLAFLSPAISRADDISNTPSNDTPTYATYQESTASPDSNNSAYYVNDMNASDSDAEQMQDSGTANDTQAPGTRQTNQSYTLTETSDTTTVDPDGGTTASAVTPEPSSLALLGTGMLSVAGMARRRFLQA